MRTIAIMNLKGGVAKTTTTVNVAAILAHDHKKKVLVVDADSQCNTTEFLGAPSGGGTLADLIRSKELPGSYRYTVMTNIPGVELIPGSDELMDLDLTKVETSAVNVSNLQVVLQTFAKHGTYDVCLIDCPPAFNAASAAALLAADEVMIPIKLDAFSLRGMANLMRQIDNMREINPALRLLGFLPTMWYRGKLIEDAETTLRNAGFAVLPHIRRTDKADAVTFAQRPLIEVSPKCAAAIDYRRLVRYIVKGGVQNG